MFAVGKEMYFIPSRRGQKSNKHATALYFLNKRLEGKKVMILTPLVGLPLILIPPVLLVRLRPHADLVAPWVWVSLLLGSVMGFSTIVLLCLGHHRVAVALLFPTGIAALGMSAWCRLGLVASMLRLTCAYDAMTGTDMLTTPPTEVLHATLYAFRPSMPYELVIHQDVGHRPELAGPYQTIGLNDGQMVLHVSTRGMGKDELRALSVLMYLLTQRFRGIQTPLEEYEMQGFHEVLL